MEYFTEDKKLVLYKEEKGYVSVLEIIKCGVDKYEYYSIDIKQFTLHEAFRKLQRQEKNSLISKTVTKIKSTTNNMVDSGLISEFGYSKEWVERFF